MAEDDNPKRDRKRSNLILGGVLALAALAMFVGIIVKMS